MPVATAALFAVVLNIPTAVSAATLPGLTTMIMFACLSLLGIALGGLIGWALEPSERIDDPPPLLTREPIMGQVAGTF